MISIVFIRCTLFLFEETDMGSVAKKVFYNNLKGSDPGRIPSYIHTLNKVKSF